MDRMPPAQDPGEIDLTLGIGAPRTGDECPVIWSRLSRIGFSAVKLECPAALPAEDVDLNMSGGPWFHCSYLISAIRR